jgi:hypothetical protein
MCGQHSELVIFIHALLGCIMQLSDVGMFKFLLVEVILF